MKIFLLLFSAITLAFGADQIESITDNMEVIIKDSKGNKTNGGRLIDQLKIRKTEVQAKLDAKLAALATGDASKARIAIEAAKAQGAEIASETEEAVVAKETFAISEQIWALIDKHPAEAVKLFDENKEKYVFSEELSKAIDEIRQ